jgi:hypothetical protein
VKPSSRAVLNELRYGPLTQQDAIRLLSCYRLAARIADLRADGYPITSEMVSRDGVRFARYRLVEAPVQVEMGL